METTEKYVVKFDRNGQPTWIVPAVDPNGNLKFVRVNKWVNGGIIEVSPKLNSQGREVRDPEHAIEVRIKGHLEPHGWALLADLFAADNKWRAWQVFRDWMIESFVKERDVPVFPRDRLPKGVQLRAERKAPHQVEYSFDFDDDEAAQESDASPTPSADVRQPRAEKRPAGPRQEAAKA